MDEEFSGLLVDDSSDLMKAKDLNMKHNQTFTRVDLVVTLLCTAFLVVTLGAVGNRGRRRAIRLVCASNLNLWYRAIKAQSNDNDGQLLETVSYSENDRYPCEAYFEADDPGWPHAGMFNTEAFTPYLAGFNPDGLTREDIMGLPPDSPQLQGLRMKGPWTCPANKSESIDFVISTILHQNYLRLQYSYYARVEKWPDNATDPQDLTADELSPGRIIMADQIYYYGPYGGICLYNHGLKGYSWDGGPDDYMQLCDEEGPPKITGINKLFGDGRVIWKDRSEFDIPNMHLNEAADRLANPHVIGHTVNVANFY